MIIFLLILLDWYNSSSTQSRLAKLWSWRVELL